MSWPGLALAAFPETLGWVNRGQMGAGKGSVLQRGRETGPESDREGAEKIWEGGEETVGVYRGGTEPMGVRVGKKKEERKMVRGKGQGMKMLKGKKEERVEEKMENAGEKGVSVEEMRELICILLRNLSGLQLLANQEFGQIFPLPSAAQDP